MKKIFSCVFIIILAVSSALHAGNRKAVLFMIDGLRSDAFFTSPTPNIDSIKDGTWTEGYKGAYSLHACPIPDAIPNSAPNHVAILTGVTANKNGCYNNGETAGADYEKYPPISALIKQTIPGLKSAWLYHWSEDQEIPTGATYIAPPQGDQQVVDNAVALLNGSFPTQKGIQGSVWTHGDDIDLLMLYIDDCDGAGHTHRFSTTSPEYLAAVRVVDRQIGEILNAIRNRPNFKDEEWMITLCADHGGIDHEHGVWNAPDSYTTPLLVSSKEVDNGTMRGDPRNLDAAAYIVKHFTGTVPEHFDAKINEVSAPQTRSFADGLIAYFPFEGNIRPSVGNISGTSPADKLVYSESGRVGQALSLTGTNPVCFGKPEPLQFGTTGDFTIALWIRTNMIQNGRAPIFGNKMQRKGIKLGDNPEPGVLLEGNIITYEYNNLNFSLGDSIHHHNINCLVYKPDSCWYLAAITFDHDGDACLYLGYPDGTLAFVAQRLCHFGNLNNLDWYLGQDGTGLAADPFVGDVDELMIWNRSLTAEEINQLYQIGLNGESVLN